MAPFEPVSLKEVSSYLEYSEDDLESILDKLAARGMLFKGDDGEGKKGYALHQFGFGMPQAIFWPNEDTPYARRLAHLSHSPGLG